MTDASGASHAERGMAPSKELAAVVQAPAHIFTDDEGRVWMRHEFEGGGKGVTLLADRTGLGCNVVIAETAAQPTPPERLRGEVERRESELASRRDGAQADAVTQALERAARLMCSGCADELPTETSRHGIVNHIDVNDAEHLDVLYGGWPRFACKALPIRGLISERRPSHE